MDMCVHKLTRKGQKVYLGYYSEVILSEKEQKEPSKRGWLKTMIWGEDPAERVARQRYLVIDEGKLLSLKAGEVGSR